MYPLYRLPLVCWDYVFMVLFKHVFILIQVAPSSMSCKAGIMVIPVLLSEILSLHDVSDNSWLDFVCVCGCVWNLSSCSFLLYKVSSEKSANTLLGFPLV